MDELLAAIVEDPSDDELRRVYADRLCELGDPQGELIHLQLARELSDEVRERVHHLIARHASDWLGPLLAVLSDYEFERGFLAKATVPRHRRPYNVDRVVGHPLWATVERFSGPSEIYLDPIMRSLREVVAAGGPGLRELCMGEVRRPIRRLCCQLVRHEQLDDIGRCEALPELVELEVPLEDFASFASEGPAILDTLARLLALPVMPRLERLVLDPPGWRPPLVPAVIEVLERMPTVATVVAPDPWRFRWTLVRTGARYRRVTVVVANLDPLAHDRLVEQLGRLDTASQVHVHVGDADPTLLPRLATAGKRFDDFQITRR